MTLNSGGVGDSPTFESVSTEDSYSKRDDQIRKATEFDGANGGEQIQAAMENLSARGGRVEIPVVGPDTLPFSDGVWSVEEQRGISTPEHAITLQGHSPGWSAQTSGSTIAEPGNGNIMVEVDTGFLASVRDLHFRGGGRTDTFAAIEFHDTNDLQVVNCLFEACERGVNAYAAQNLWIDRCWIEKTKNGIELGGNEDSFWITDLLCFDNNTDIVVLNNNGRIWVDNYRTDSPLEHAIKFDNGTNTVNYSYFKSCEIEGAGESSPGSYDGIHINGNLTNVTFDGISVRGTGDTRHAINHAGGSLKDCSFWNIYAEGLTGTVLNGIVGSGNGTRTVVNGHAWNSGNPSTGGDWNGNEGMAVERGVHTVWDDSTSPPTAYTPYVTASGSGWRAKNYTSA